MSFRTSALKSSVVYGGSTILNAVNGLTPHIAGAVDIMAVQQPDGSFKSSPFYVRFGKYTHLRNRDRIVKLVVNGTPAGFHMVLGTYGQAYFASEVTEIVSEDGEEPLQDDLTGMSSPASGYSSGDEGAPYLTEQMAHEIRKEIAELNAQKQSAASETSDGAQSGPSAAAQQGAAQETLADLLGEPSLKGMLDVDPSKLHAIAQQPGTPPRGAHRSPNGKPATPTASSDATSDERVVVMERPPLPAGAFDEVLRMFDEDPAQTTATFTNGSAGDNGTTADDGSLIAVVTPPLETASSSSTGGEASTSGQLLHGMSGDSFHGLDLGPQSPGASAEAAPSGAIPVPKISANGTHLASQDTGQPPGPSMGSSPDAGYLGDGETHTLAPPQLSADLAKLSGGKAGAVAMGLQDFQMSLCGHLMRKDMDSVEAQQVFEAHKVNMARFAKGPAALLSDPNLVCRVGALLLPWSAAAPVVVGMLAFGGNGLCILGSWPYQQASYNLSIMRRWDHLVSDAVTLKAVGPAVPESPSKASLSQIEGRLSSGSSTLSSYLRLWPFGWSSSTASNMSTSKAAAAAVAATTPVNGNGKPSSRPMSPPMSPPEASAAEGILSPSGAAQRVRRKKHITVAKKSLSPSTEQLASLNLKEGQNTIVYKVGTTTELRAYIYMFRWRTRLLISDVDGTITRSDLLGHVLPAIGYDWSHAGIAQLYCNICSNGYKIMFLSSRAIAQASITRDYLHTLEQGGARMPMGPVIISPQGLLPSLYREMILRRPHEFKIACLQDIRALFPPEWNPFYAGFGNRETDVISYKEVGVSLSRIFIINPKGEIRKASSAVQSSTWSSLQAINDLVDEVFPTVPADEVPTQEREEYNDLQYWRSNTWYGADNLEENPKSPENTASYRQSLD